MVFYPKSLKEFGFDLTASLLQFIREEGQEEASASSHSSSPLTSSTESEACELMLSSRK